MKTYFLTNKHEQMRMNCIFSNGGADLLQAIIEHLPERVNHHSRRVSELVGIMAGYVPSERIPDGLSRDSYRSALICAAYYHDIGIYLARNNIHARAAAAERLIIDCQLKEYQSPYNDIVLETVRHCHCWYTNRQRTDIKDMPLHASICAVADAADMFFGGNHLDRKKINKAMKYIQKNSGILFLPEAVAYFEKARMDNFSFYEQEIEIADLKGMRSYVG